MLNIYRSLSQREKVLVWVVAIASIVAVGNLAGSSSFAVVWAQTASAIGTLALASLAYAQVRELRETRIAQERPQVIVDTDHNRPPLVYVVLRNIGKGAAKNVTFEFSNRMESPESTAPYSPVVAISDQPYFVQGVDYLAPGAEISCLWGSMINLAEFLREQNLHEGITITSRYESLLGKPYKTRWTVNPLLIADRVSTRQKGANEIAEVIEHISRAVDSWHSELRVSTESERQQRQSE